MWSLVRKLNSAIHWILVVSTVIKIGTLGVHVSAQRNSMVAVKKFSFTIISKHLYFEVTIQPAAGYLVELELF